MNSSHFPRRITLAGTPQEMGAQHGEELRDLICELSDERLAIILDSHPSITLDLVMRVANQILQETLRQLPEVFEESRATALAAGLPHWKLLVAGGFSDVYDVCNRAVGTVAPRCECTLWPAFGKDGDACLVGTWDTHASAQGSLVVVERWPNGGVGALALATAGWPMQQGVTSAGLAFAIANLGATTNAVGTSYICSLIRIATALSVQEATHTASLISLCSARYYAFVDAAGSFSGVETDGRSCWRISERAVHTNHFLVDDAKPFEGRPNIVAESEARRQAALRYMDSPKQAIADVFPEVSYDDRIGVSIYRHGVGRDDRTCAVFVLNPAVQRITFTPGPPGDSVPRQMSIT